MVWTNKQQSALQDEFLKKVDVQNSISSIIAIAKADTKFTPDYWKLQQFKRQLLFVCDDMQLRHPRHDKLEWAPILHGGWVAYTAQRSFQMFKRATGPNTYPIPLRSKTKFLDDDELTLGPGVGKTPICRIRGEVYVLRPEQFLSLDKEKLHTIEFQRERVPIVMVPHSGALRVVTAWMYIGIRDYWEEIIDHGFLFPPVRFFPSSTKMGRYYNFTVKEYEVNKT